jgi:hypothetical protein
MFNATKQIEVITDETNNYRLRANEHTMLWAPDGPKRVTVSAV